MPTLMLRRLPADLMARLSRIDHVKIVRFHTRVPAVDPARITPTLVEALKAPGKTTWIALHANHPDELTPPAAAARVAGFIQSAWASRRRIAARTPSSCSTATSVRTMWHRSSKR